MSSTFFLQQQKTEYNIHFIPTKIVAVLVDFINDEISLFTEVVSCYFIMSYTELEHGYQGLRNSGRPTQFYVGAVSFE